MSRVRDVMVSELAVVAQGSEGQAGCLWPYVLYCVLCQRNPGSNASVRLHRLPALARVALKMCAATIVVSSYASISRRCTCESLCCARDNSQNACV